MKEPLLNILTRTSNRPNGFKRNVQSIVNQTYKNVNHIVCTDDEQSISYIKENGITDYVFIDSKELKLLLEGHQPPGQHDQHVMERYAPHNLYFNKIHKLINAGWIIYLDDDDMLFDENSLMNVASFINHHDEDTLIIWRMSLLGGIIPNKLGLPPQYGQIGSPCFTFHKKHIEHATWDCWKGDDFKVVSHLYGKIPKHTWYPTVIALVTSVGSGLRRDVSP